MMVERSGRFGPFLGCSGFPECRKIMPAPEQMLGVFCPKPDCPGEIIQKRSKKGRIFYGCNQYPNCDFVTWNRPSAQEKCETCGYPMGEKLWRGRVTGKECTNRECPTVQVKAFSNPLADPDAEGPEIPEAAATTNGARKTTPKAAASKTAKSKTTTPKGAPSKTAKGAAAKATPVKGASTNARSNGASGNGASGTVKTGAQSRKTAVP